ncbi:DUF742 domain-containing protein [Thermoactinospora rubra]|uniref:DUF742 domain-containing protein n=1 Tax=Thermoactinospora rubra TaxID=1088767 RepID=UPI000A0F68AE|nr:DUF742 domain-containing protein [Thermoactinospora rubra]
MTHQRPDRSTDPGLLRPFVVTRGRTKPAQATFTLITQVMAIAPAPADGLDPEHLAIMRLCAGPVSAAELAADLDLPPGAVYVLLDDLLRQGLIAVQNPRPTDHDDVNTFKAVIDGLRAL